jgi:cytosine/adenosine deaminase-related metal-dependent hydrolase
MENSSNYILIQDATIISDGASTILQGHDILIQNDRIIAVGKDLTTPKVANLTKITANGDIAIPGFVDGHHHMWQQLPKGIATDWTLFDYMANMCNMYGSIFTPDDVYLATYAAALSLLDNGVTTVLEHCHIINSPAHADAAIRGLKDAGIRGTFCYGFHENPAMPGHSAHGTHAESFTQESRVADAARVREQHFDSNDPAEELLTFGIALDEPEFLPVEEIKEAIRLSRELGARLITMHVAMGFCDATHRHIVQELSDANLLGPDLVLSHGTSLTDTELRAIKASGAGIVGTPDTEVQMGMRLPVVFRARDAGCHTCLGIDITSNQSNNLIAQMRLALRVQRAVQNEQDGHLLQIARKTTEVLRMGTLGGAEVL